MVSFAVISELLDKTPTYNKGYVIKDSYADAVSVVFFLVLLLLRLVVAGFLAVERFLCVVVLGLVATFSSTIG